MISQRRARSRSTTFAFFNNRTPNTANWFEQCYRNRQIRTDDGILHFNSQSICNVHLPYSYIRVPWSATNTAFRKMLCTKYLRTRDLRRTTQNNVAIHRNISICTWFSKSIYFRLILTMHQRHLNGKSRMGKQSQMLLPESDAGSCRIKNLPREPATL